MWFENYTDAYEYTKNIDKRNYEIGCYQGKVLFLCSTSIPIENRLRLPIESMVNDFVKDMIKEGAEITIDNDSTIGEFIIDLSADVSDYILKEIEKQTNIRFVCSYDNY